MLNYLRDEHIFKPPFTSLWKELLEMHLCPKLQCIVFLPDFAFILRDKLILFYREKDWKSIFTAYIKMP